MSNKKCIILFYATTSIIADDKIFHNAISDKSLFCCDAFRSNVRMTYDHFNAFNEHNIGEIHISKSSKYDNPFVFILRYNDIGRNMDATELDECPYCNAKICLNRCLIEQ